MWATYDLSVTPTVIIIHRVHSVKVHSHSSLDRRVTFRNDDNLSLTHSCFRYFFLLMRVAHLSECREDCFGRWHHAIWLSRGGSIEIEKIIPIRKKPFYGKWKHVLSYSYHVDWITFFSIWPSVAPIFTPLKKTLTKCCLCTALALISAMIKIKP